MMNTLLRRLLPAACALALAVSAFLPAAASGEAPAIKDTVASSSLSGSFLAAQIASKDNDDEAAVAFYERAVALDPENRELKYMLFLALTSNGRVADAVGIGRSLPQTGDQAGFIRLVMAVQAVKQKSWAKVPEILGEPEGGELDVLVERLLNAWASFGAGDVDAALAQVRAVDGADWANVVRDYHGGLIAAAAGRDLDAETFLQQATKDDSLAAVLSETYLRAIEALVRVEDRLGKPEAAQQALDNGLRLLPNHPPFRALKAELESKTAVPPLVTTAQQGASELFFNVGSAISRQGGASFAQGYLQLAEHMNPGSDVISVALAGVFENQKNHARANTYYERIGATSPYYRRARLEYALNLNEMKQVDEAKKVLDELIAQDPDDLIAYTTLGGVLSQHEEYRAAADIYDKAVARLGTPRNSNWDLFYRRGIAYERLKEWDKAEPNFRKSLELSPDQANVLNYLGYSWIDMGINLEEGMAMIRKAVELKPGSGFIVDSLGWAHYRLGQYEDAVVELERAVELMPEDPVVNDHLGDAYWMVGRRLEATFQWNHALANKPEPADELKIREKLAKGLVAPTPAVAETQPATEGQTPPVKSE